MPWHNGDFPPSYKNQPRKIRDLATEIANKYWNAPAMKVKP